MELNQFIVSSLATLIAMLPQFFITIATVSYNLKGIKNKTSEFPESINKTKEQLEKSFIESKDVLVNSFVDMKENLMESFKDATSEMKEVLNNAMDDIAQKVNGTLTGMQSELNHYREELMSSRDQSNMLVKENKLYMEVLISLLASDPNLVKQGISNKLIHKINMTKEELEKYPNTLITDLRVLEKAIKEVVYVNGKESLDTLFKELGYERKKL